MADSSDFKLRSVHAAESSTPAEEVRPEEVRSGVTAVSEEKAQVASSLGDDPQAVAEPVAEPRSDAEPQAVSASEVLYEPMQEFSPAEEDPQEKAARLRRERLAKQAEELQRQEENLGTGKVPLSGVRTALVVVGVLVLVAFAVLYSGVIPW